MNKIKNKIAKNDKNSKKEQKPLIFNKIRKVM